MACEVCYGYRLVSSCPCCSPEVGWDDEDAEAEEREADAVREARCENALWGRLYDAGYEIDYDYDGEVAVFERAEKLVRRATRTARRDHRDGYIKAGQRYTESTVRFVDAEGRKWHEVRKRVIG